MLAEIITLLFASACGLFVLSLPLSKTALGGALRRWAGVCFVLALLPSLLWGLFFAAHGAASAPDGSDHLSGTSRVSQVLANLGCIVLIALLALVAYAALRLRARMRAKAKPTDPWDRFFRSGGGKKRSTRASPPNASP
jgi:hypothetical protein